MPINNGGYQNHCRTNEMQLKHVRVMINWHSNDCTLQCICLV